MLVYPCLTVPVASLSGHRAGSSSLNSLRDGPSGLNSPRDGIPWLLKTHREPGWHPFGENSHRDGQNSHWDGLGGLHFHRDHPGRDRDTGVCY